jgi:primosomal protein N' (replication factor Y) (superfamily II helicase)
MFHFAQIAVDVPIRKLFDYRIPHAFVSTIQAGARVLVPFGSRKLVGIVVRLTHETHQPIEQMKSLVALLSPEPVMTPNTLSLCLWASNYYHHPIGEVIFNAIPTKLREYQTQIAKPPTESFIWQLTELGEVYTPEHFNKAPKQQKAWQLLKEHAQGLTTQTLKSFGIPTSTLESLEKRQIISKQPLLPTPQSYHVHSSDHSSTTLLAEAPLQLTEEQQRALTALTQENHAFHVFLLQGVTGSGKTEVYLQAIHYYLLKNKQALILIPEINLTPQTLARFKKRFSCAIECFHSKISPNEKQLAWERIKKGTSRLLIGTRSAVFTPMPELGLIIIDEEHDSSFKQQESFRYSARDIAIWRAKNENIPILLGSATPALETWYNAIQHKFSRLLLSYRPQQSVLTRFELINTQNEKRIDGLSKPLIRAIEETLHAQEQVILFLNRRGYAPIWTCASCNWQATCVHCDARLVLHQSPTRLQCHTCLSCQKVMQSCPKCQQPHMQTIGIGTQKIEETLQAHFKQIPIIRIDRDSTRLKNSLEDKLALIYSGKPCILAGTKMLSKGHHFPKVTLVAIPDADQGLFTTDFRGAENLAQLIVQVSGRAGRGEKPGRVLIQTNQPEHPLWSMLPKHDYDICLQALLAERKGAHLPPFSYLALMRVECPQLEKIHAFFSECTQLLTTQQIAEKQVQMMGPVPAPMAKKSGALHYQLLFIADKRNLLHEVIASLIFAIEQTKIQRQVKWSIDIDPIDLY